MKKILIVAASLALFTSCATTNKSKSTKTAEVKTEATTRADSTVKSVTDSATVKNSATITTVESTDNYTTTTVIEFDTAVNNSPLLGLGADAADYFEPVITVGNITAPGRIKRITQTATGVKREDKKTIATASDSTKKTTASEAAKITVTKVKNESKTSEKTKKVFRFDMTGLVVFGILFLILAAILYYYRKRIKLFFVGLNILK